MPHDETMSISRDDDQVDSEKETSHDDELVANKLIDEVLPSLHWTLSVKDVSTVPPLKFNCSTCVAGEQTKVTLDNDAFELMDLKDVHVIVPVKAEKVDFPKTIIGGGR
ncbi:hypothetical protein Tco_0213999 [Tanacetum coccineum]